MTTTQCRCEIFPAVCGVWESAKNVVVQWGLVVIWVLFPEGSYGGLWLTGAFIVLSLVAGAKLHIVAMHLSRHAYYRFYKPYSRKPSKHELLSVAESNIRDSPTSRKSPAGALGEAVEKEGHRSSPDDLGEDVPVSEAGSSKRVPLRRIMRGHSQRIKGAAEDEDLRKLFWFRSPRLMLRIFRCAAALHACVQPRLCKTLWGGPDTSKGGVSHVVDGDVHGTGSSRCMLFVATTATCPQSDGSNDLIERKGAREDVRAGTRFSKAPWELQHSSSDSGRMRSTSWAALRTTMAPL